MVYNYGRRTRIATAIMALVAILLTAMPVVAIGAEAGEIEVTCGTSGLDPLGQGKAMGSGPFCRLGQRLTIPNRLVTEIGYRVWKVGNPTGDIVLSIRDFATDRVITSMVWGDASELSDPDVGGIQKVRLSEPVRVNGEVILCVEYYGGNTTDHCVGGYRTGNYRDGETYMNYHCGRSWHDIGEAEEGGYYYAYVDEGTPDPPQNGGNGGDTEEDGTGNTGLIAAGATIGVFVVGGGFLLYRDRKRRKKTTE